MTSRRVSPISDSATRSLPQRRCVLVCQNRSCLRSDSDQVLAAFQAQTELPIFVSPSQCLGQCGSGPTVKVMPDDTWYCRVKVADVAEIVAQHLHQNQPVKRLLHPRFHLQYEAYEPPPS
ncbi:(2Fe-2S) ferredoxin domain-containing protein [Almyronema epifaneia]|uniref:Ferredoxin n=1 Tax=Almyronema epifaneia S1 TaxID=2991925 RepID=A0ABW6IEB9_9CYAN